LSFPLKSELAALGVMCGRERCHCVVPRNCCATRLDVCAGRFPSAVSEHRRRSFRFTVRPGGTNSLCMMFSMSRTKRIDADLTLFGICHAFLGRVLHRDDRCRFVSGPCPPTQDSSPAKMAEMEMASFSVCSEADALFFLVAVHYLVHRGTDFARNKSHFELMRQNSSTRSIRQFGNVRNIANRSSSRTVSHTCHIFLVVVSDGVRNFSFIIPFH
jgi:hypothetical protein